MLVNEIVEQIRTITSPEPTVAAIAFCDRLFESVLHLNAQERQLVRAALRQNPHCWDCLKPGLLDHYLERNSSRSWWYNVLMCVALTGGIADWRDTIVWMEQAWERSPDIEQKLDDLRLIGPLAQNDNKHGISEMSTQGLIINAARNIYRRYLNGKSKYDWPACHVMIDRDEAPTAYRLIYPTLVFVTHHLPVAEAVRIGCGIVLPDLRRQPIASDRHQSFESRLEDTLRWTWDIENGFTRNGDALNLNFAFEQIPATKEATLALRATDLTWSQAACTLAQQFSPTEEEVSLLKKAINFSYFDTLQRVTTAYESFQKASKRESWATVVTKRISQLFTRSHEVQD